MSKQDKTATEKRRIGRPSSVEGKRVQVYLDAASLEAAAKLGHGKVSNGIRQALKIAATANTA